MPQPFHFFFLFFLFSITLQASSLVDENMLVVDGDFYIIELSSMCFNDDTNPLNKHAMRLHSKLHFIVTSLQDQNGTLKIGLISIDVCNSSTTLINTLSELILNPTILRPSEKENENRNSSKAKCLISDCLYKRKNIFAFVSFMPLAMTRIAADILTIDFIPYFAYTNRVTTTLTETHRHFYPSFQLLYSDIDDLEYRIKTQNVYHISLLIIGEKTNNRLAHIHREKIWDTLVSYDTYCVNKVNLDAQNVSQIKQFISDIKKDETLEIIIVWTELIYYQNFLGLTKEINDKIWYWYTDNIHINTGLNYFNHNDSDSFFLDNHIFINHPIYSYRHLTSHNDFETSFYSNYSKSNNGKDLWIERYEKENSRHTSSLSYVRLSDSTSDDLVDALVSPIWWSVKAFNPQKDTIEETHLAIDKLTVPSVCKYVLHSQTNAIRLEQCTSAHCDTRLNSSRRHAHCLAPICRAGFEGTKIFYAMSKNDIRYNWNCQKCPKDYVKFSPSNDSCHPCSNDTISNFERTRCVDDITEIYLHFTSTTAIILLLCVLPLVILNITAIVIFFHFYKTPVIRSCGSNSSIIQLCTHLLIYIEILTTFIGKPTTETCFAQVFLTGFLFTVILSIIFTKIQKLLFAFKAKGRITKKDIFLSNTVKVFISSILVFVQCVITITNALTKDDYADVVTTNKKREYFCTNKTQFHIQLAYLLLLAFVCSFQAFRARSLPSHFNETKRVAISMYITIILICLRFPFSESHKVKDKNILNVVIILLINTSQLVIIFASPCFTVVFRKERNTRSHFRNTLKFVCKVHPTSCSTTSNVLVVQKERVERMRKITMVIVNNNDIL